MTADQKHELQTAFNNAGNAANTLFQLLYSFPNRRAFAEQILNNDNSSESDEHLAIDILNFPENMVEYFRDVIA